ncbi:MAG: T9SS type A sorting domain-containing protein, partial [Ignavibacteria bacterium]
FASSVPTTIIDGKLFASIPYGDSINLYTPFLKRLSVGTPLSISVADIRVEGDSIKTTISLNIASSLPAGNYRLRINAVERYVADNALNGETNFYDVFRKYYPDSNGFQISTDPGSFKYTYTYYREPSWVDSMLYTAVFIQNDNNREVLNCAKGRNIVMSLKQHSSKIVNGKSDIPDNVNLINGNRQFTFSADSVQTQLNIELFEAFFPPLGWKIFNRDGYITFSQYNGANGPTFGGVKAVIMDFFDYNIPGQKDSMYSKPYTGLLVTDTVQFNYSYAQYNSANIDSLIVRVSTDGGITFPTEVFRRGGLALATAPQTTSFFVPTNNSQWRSFRFGLSDIVSINNSGINIPERFELQQNFPNPFNPSTVIKYNLSIGGNVSFKIYNLLGKELLTLVNQKQSAGSYEIIFDGINFASGVYFYNLTTEGFTETKRMVLIK